MTAVGPTLPPHLQTKRKRTSSSSPPPKRSRSTSPPSKPSRTIGPALPPAPLSTLPTTAPNPSSDSDSDSSDDSDFGPAPPPPPGTNPQPQKAPSKSAQQPQEAQAPPKPQREEWMLAPPTHSDWTTRIDPTKLKNRKFNTGKGAKAPPSRSAAESGGGISAIWTETPEQKRQRLEDEVLGVSSGAAGATTGRNDGAGGGGRSARERREEEYAAETERRIRAFHEKERRGKSLLDKHVAEGKEGGKVGREEEDDPTARAFDREKDVGLGGRVGGKAKAEMLRRAGEMGGRFSGGKYL